MARSRTSVKPEKERRRAIRRGDQGKRPHSDTEADAKLLAESERLGTTLLNSVSHELRTPLAAIGSAASNLRSAGPLNPPSESRRRIG